MLACSAGLKHFVGLRPSRREEAKQQPPETPNYLQDSLRYGGRGPGFKAQGLGFRVEGPGFGVQGGLRSKV